MRQEFTERTAIWTDLDAGLRIVEWTKAADVALSPRPGLFVEETWSTDQWAWLCTGRSWDERSWNEGAWWEMHPRLRRGPLPTFMPDGEFLFLGTIRPHVSSAIGDLNDDPPDAWSLRRFSMQHQCAGFGMAQAVVDGALSVIEPNDESPLAAGLRALTGPYDVAELDEIGADAVAGKAATLLETSAFPSSFERACGLGQLRF